MFPEDALFDYENRLKNNDQPGKSISDVFAEAKESTVSKETPKKTGSPKDDLINLLKELGFDYLDFTSNDLEKILANYSTSILRSNVLFAIDNGIELDIFIDNVELLYDSEFEQKIQRLMEVGKEPFDIYLNPNILIKYNKSDLDNTINKLKSSGLDPKKVPLIAY